MERLRAVKAWAGNPSLRDLERRTRLPRSTLSADLSLRRSGLPPLERVLALATAFGLPAEDLGRWRSAWQRIQVRQQSTGRLPAPPGPAAVPERGSAAVPAAVPGLLPAAVPDLVPDLVPRCVPPAAREPERTVRHRSARRRRMWPVLSVGGLLAALTVLPPSVAPVGEDGSGAAADGGSTSPVGARVPDPCGFLGRVSDTPAASPPDAAATTGESLRVRNQVARGDTLIVTLLLARAGVGPITVRDTAGNRYRAIRDETTDGTRLTVFVLHDARPLDSLDQITFLWPSSKHDYTEVDEFRGARPTAPASAAGDPGAGPSAGPGTPDAPGPADEAPAGSGGAAGPC
ncbi:hypothetical protein [Kitasatospora purpeofusca]|uniref:hypothetical protein n=1 Tax=Kitasatospora purpeofusca TaxID=67352 RepID=UPI0036B22949